DRDLARGLTLVVVVVGEDLGHRPPQPRLLVRVGGMRAGVEAVALHLHVDLGIGEQVEIPGRVLGRAAARRDDEQAVAVAAVDQWQRALLAAAAAAGGQEQRGVAVPVVAFGAVGLDVAVDVVGVPGSGRLLITHVLDASRSWSIAAPMLDTPSVTTAEATMAAPWPGVMRPSVSPSATTPAGRPSCAEARSPAGHGIRITTAMATWQTTIATTRTSASRISDRDDASERKFSRAPSDTKKNGTKKPSAMPSSCWARRRGSPASAMTIPAAKPAMSTLVPNQVASAESPKSASSESRR